MKREINCLKCGTRWGKTSYPDEEIKYVSGWSKTECVCDGCNKQITVGHPVTAVSIWAPNKGIKYWPWECNVLTPASEAELVKYDDAHTRLDDQQPEANDGG